MRPLPLFALACLPLLGACQWLAPQPAPPAVQKIAWEQRAEGCRSERCSLVNVETLRISDAPALDALIERALLAMTRETDGQPLPASLRGYADALLAEAQAVARSRFDIGHTTFQLESGALPDCPTC